MPKYRKKPVVVEAHQWFKNGDHPRMRDTLANLIFLRPLTKRFNP